MADRENSFNKNKTKKIQNKFKVTDGTLISECSLIPTFGNRCLSAIGGGKQRSRLAGWVQLSTEAAPCPTGYRHRHPVDENIDDAGNLHE